jgi:hypothetical protein
MGEIYESRPTTGNSARRRLAIHAEVHPSLSSAEYYLEKVVI